MKDKICTLHTYNLGRGNAIDLHQEVVVTKELLWFDHHQEVVYGTLLQNKSIEVNFSSKVFWFLCFQMSQWVVVVCIA